MQGEQPQDKPGWQYVPDEGGGTVDAPGPSFHKVDPVSWTASEYIAHQKTASWYIMLGIGTAMLAILAYLLTRGDLISSGIMLIVGVIFGTFAARKPNVLQYAVNDSGIHIGSKLYAYGDFKSFAVQDEGAFSSILLLPLKRFMPAISIYFAPEDENKIVEALAAHLPLEHRPQDSVERLMRRLRF